jgi:hypothetical protein
MASSTSTITATIGLSGNGMTSQTLAVGRATSLSITSPTLESGAQIVPVSASFTTLVDGTLFGKVPGYFYIKNTEPTTAATITIYHDTVASGTLKQNEWAFFPTKADAIIKVQGSLPTTCEYGFWTQA